MNHEEAKLSRSWPGGSRRPGELVGKARRRKPHPRATAEDHSERARRSQVDMRVDGHVS